MSWDILIWNIARDIHSTEEMEKRYNLKTPQDFPPMGSLAETVAAIQAALPDSDFSDPTWGRHDSGIEFNIGEEDPVHGIMLHVRGGDAAIEAIRALCEHTGWRAYDISGGGFMDDMGYGEKTKASMASWRSYRDQVLESLPNDLEEEA